MEQPGTLDSALDYAQRGHLEDWVHEFLRGAGNNVPFSDGLRLEPRRYTGPVCLPLDLFCRCCGPEENMKYCVDAEGFEERVSSMQKRLRSGWDMPPLIVNYVSGRFELNDGNHRFEALVRSGRKRYWVVLWTTGEGDYEALVHRIASGI